MADSVVFAFFLPREMIARRVPCGLSQIARRSSRMKSARRSGCPTNLPSGIRIWDSNQAIFRSAREGARDFFAIFATKPLRQ